jgi:FHS family L-fucose permease-like MFS transporter
MAAPVLASPAARASATDPDAGYRLPLVVLTSLFFMWGFLTCLNDIIIPHFKAVFELDYFRAMLVQLAFFAAYFVMSLPSGRLVRQLGYKRGIVIGLVVAATGCGIFYPAAAARSYPMFLGALFILASGITLLQVAANPYVAVLGPADTASSRLTMTQAFNSLATMLAPFFGSAVILSHAAKSAAEIKAMPAAQAELYRLAEAQAVQRPYVGLAVALLALAVLMALFKLPTIDAGPDAGAAADDDRAGSAWSYRHLVLGALGIFMYVGGEVSIGSFMVSYLKEPYIAGLTEADGARYVSWYWGGAMVGRFIGTVTLRRFPPPRLLTVHALVVVGLVCISMVTTGSLAMWTLLAVGLFNSIMFPTIFTLALDRLGKHTSQASGILCMAIVAAVCYAYVAWYGLKGFRPRGPGIE